MSNYYSSILNMFQLKNIKDLIIDVFYAMISEKIKVYIIWINFTFIKKKNY